MVNGDYIGYSPITIEANTHCTALHECSLCIDFKYACFCAKQDAFRHQFGEFVDLVDNPEQNQHAWTRDIRGRQMAHRNAPIARRRMITTAAVSLEPLFRLPRFPLDRAIHWSGPRSGNENNIWIKDTAPTTGKPKTMRRMKRQRAP